MNPNHIHVTYLYRANGVLVAQQWAYAPSNGSDLLIAGPGDGPYTADHEGITWIRGLFDERSPEVLAMRAAYALSGMESS